MLETFANIVKVKELKKKLLFTAAMLIVFRLGKFIPTPGIDVNALAMAMDDGAGGALQKLLSLADMFTGGAMRAGAIFGLGVMPYITASIIFQLLVGIVPSLERLQREGPSGRKKIQQWTRLSTVGLCAIQAIMLCKSMLAQRDMAGGGASILVPVDVMSDTMFYFYGILCLTCGSMFLMWLGEQIDEFGIGNGMSLLIMAGIIARMPETIYELRNGFSVGVGSGGSIGFGTVFVLVIMFVLMVLAVVLITLGQRRIPVQQAKATRGRRVYGGQRSYLPLRVNQSGVIPIIFAQSILMLPPILLSVIFGENASSRIFPVNGYMYTISYILFIVFFCYFYTAVTFNPNEMADNLKQSGSYVPGIRPGMRTAEYFERIMTRIALAGSIFLSFVAIVPNIIYGFMPEVGYNVSSFLGGTGLLIVVGVALDLVQRVENHLLMRNYDGFMKGGKPVRGRMG